MRVFFAIEFNNELKDYLHSIQNQLKKHFIKGNFSRKENFHLTLKFIGNVNTEQLNILKNSLNEIGNLNKTFNLSLNNLGQFKKGNKKIFWVGIKKEDLCILDLYNSLEENLYGKGFKKEERSYSPHITLCRDAIVNDFNYKDIKIENFPIKVNSISLMESNRINGLLTYTPIAKVNLK